jgi:hypothetical protein
MNSELNMMFSELKNNCETYDQAVAFNDLLATFSKKGTEVAKPGFFKNHKKAILGGAGVAAAAAGAAGAIALYRHLKKKKALKQAALENSAAGYSDDDNDMDEAAIADAADKAATVAEATGATPEEVHEAAAEAADTEAAGAAEEAANSDETLTASDLNDIYNICYCDAYCDACNEMFSDVMYENRSFSNDKYVLGKVGRFLSNDDAPTSLMDEDDEDVRKEKHGVGGFMGRHRGISALGGSLGGGLIGASIGHLAGGSKGALVGASIGSLGGGYGAGAYATRKRRKIIEAQLRAHDRRLLGK